MHLIKHLLPLVLLLISAVAVVALVEGYISSDSDTELPPVSFEGSRIATTNEPVSARHAPAPFSAGLKRPLALEVSANGDKIYAADGVCRCIRIFNAQGNIVSTLGPVFSDYEIRYPAALALNEEGNLFVADLAGGHILEFTDDAFTGLLTSGDLGDVVQAPGGIVFRDGLIYVADLQLHQVIAFDSTLTLVRRFGKGKGSGLGFLSYPNSIMVLEDEEVLVSDSNNRMQLFNPEGIAQSIWSGPVMVPRGMAVDDSRNVHVTSALGSKIDVFDRTGAWVTSYTKLSEGLEEFVVPVGIVFRVGKVYVMDRASARIHVSDVP